MRNADTPEFIAALTDFALCSGQLVLIELDMTGHIIDYNEGFVIAVRPVGDARGQLLSKLMSTLEGTPPELVAGLPGGAPIPYALRPWTGDELIFRAYPLPWDRLLLIGEQSKPSEQQVVRHMGRMNTEMSNLVRELHRSNRRNQELAQTDPLTGLANRRCFFDLLKQMSKHIDSKHPPWAVLMMDIDHFKQVNDRYGHEGGDKLLQAFADLLQRGSRSSDLAGRLGGEEFALLLSDTDLQRASRVAERIRQDMAELRPLASDQSNHVSIGIAEYQIGENCDDLMRRADQALYRAKENGRNQVEIASASAQPISNSATSHASSKEFCSTPISLMDTQPQ